LYIKVLIFIYFYSVIPSEFILKGNSEELRNKRINDNQILGIFKPLIYTTFLRTIDLRFNLISDVGAETIARFLLVKIL